jgi:hypothetical protein
MRFLAPLLILLLVLAGCASERLPATRLTRHEVMQIAIAFAQKSGCHLDGYRAPHVWGYNSQLGDWWVTFREKPPEHPDGDIMVSVDDASGVAEFLPSR